MRRRVAERRGASLLEDQGGAARRRRQRRRAASQRASTHPRLCPTPRAAGWPRRPAPLRSPLGCAQPAELEPVRARARAIACRRLWGQRGLRRPSRGSLDIKRGANLPCAAPLEGAAGHPRVAGRAARHACAAFLMSFPLHVSRVLSISSASRIDFNDSAVRRLHGTVGRRTAAVAAASGTSTRGGTSLTEPSPRPAARCPN